MRRISRSLFFLLAACAGMTLAVAAPASAAQLPAVTFNKDIAPILFKNCAGCHRPGEVAPFSLLTYMDAKKHASQLADVTESKYMPPWLPEMGHGEFRGDRRLEGDEIKLFRAWSDAGAPEGDAKDLPASPKFAEGWSLGEPDLVVKMPEKYTLKAEGRDVFRVFVIPLELTEDKYVAAIDFRPSNRKIVHHALFFLDNSGQARKLDAQDPEPGYARSGGIGFTPSGGLGGWAPGVTPHFLPDGVARQMRKGTDLVVQVHFHPSGKVEEEQATIGFYFAKKTPDRLALSIPKPFRRNQVDIAPGAKNYSISDSFVLPVDFDLVGLFPHAHLLCKEMKVDATLPDGTTIPLLWIKDWDWNWQDEFLYKKDLHLPRGTRIDQTYVFDNSTDNVHNPSSPPRHVTWGEQTADEMAITFFLVSAPRDALIFQLGGSGASGRGQGARDAIREALRQRQQTPGPSTAPAAADQKKESDK